MQPANSEAATQPGGSVRLRLFRPDNNYAALGLAVSHLMVKPAFAKLPFGDWSRILVGQINRGHYTFVIDEKKQIQGFLGWALATREKAEAWVTGRAGLSYEDSLDGDCFLVNAWVANSPEVRRLLLDAARRLWEGKQTIYFRRLYPSGITRPVRLNVNAFNGQHIGHRADGAS